MSIKPIVVDDLTFKLRNDKTAVLVRSPEQCYVKDDVKEKNIRDVVIPVSISFNGDEYYVTEIGQKAFYKVKINSLKFAEGSKVVRFGKGCFHDSNIKELMIPASLEEFDAEWCSGVDCLECVNVDPQNPAFVMNEKGILLSRDGKNLIFCLRNVNDVEIPNTVELIMNYAFENCGQLNKVIFQENSNLVKIGMNAFSSTSLNEIEIPNTTKEICKAAFYCTISLTTVKFQPGSMLEKIGESAFQYSSLTEIEIPQNVKVIGIYAFYYCQSLTKVTFAPNSKVKIIEPEAFRDSGLTEIEIPKNVTIFNHNLFRNCNNLTKVLLQCTRTASFQKDSFAGINLKNLIIIIYDTCKMTGQGIPPEHCIKIKKRKHHSINPLNDIEIISMTIQLNSDIENLKKEIESKKEAIGILERDVANKDSFIKHLKEQQNISIEAYNELVQRAKLLNTQN